MIMDRRGVPFPNVSESAFTALNRRVAGLPTAERESVYATFFEDRDEFWGVMLSDLVEDPELRAAFRVALTEEGLNDE
jgi:hypothetical protein